MQVEMSNGGPANCQRVPCVPRESGKPQNYPPEGSPEPLMKRVGSTLTSKRLQFGL